METNLAIAYNGVNEEKEKVLTSEELKFLENLPKLESWMKLPAKAKKIYAWLGLEFIETKKLKAVHINHLAMLANEIYTYWFANEEIMKREKKQVGSGLIQVFQSGAANVTAYYTLREKSLKHVLTLGKQFGMSIKDDKELDSFIDNSQTKLDLF